MTKKEYKFKEWIELEEKKEQVIRAVEEVKEDFPPIIIDFLSTALSLDKGKLQEMFWVEVLNLFSEVSLSLMPSKSIPILMPHKEKHERDIWDYDGRSWHFYSHLLASTYGWNLEYISGLSVEDALSQIQEILTQQQLDREFTWGMSEASVIYDSKTKTSKPNPLPRPYWMKEVRLTSESDLPIKKFKIGKEYLPVGIIDYSSVSDEFKPKEA
jgi:hypothetical protein